MKLLLVLVLAATLFFGLGSVLSCSCGDDDDDDSSGDDDDAGDDDAGDDDAGDDDGGGDDDDVSGELTWQVSPSDEGMTWAEAKEYCEKSSFDGHDDWRLPTISELRSLIRGCDETELGGACGVTDDCTEYDCWTDTCSGCEYLAGPGSGGAYWPDGMSGAITWYWSSSPVADSGDGAWLVNFDNGNVTYYSTGNDYHTRCVRP